MNVVRRNPVPIYAVVCHECKSEIEYQASEVAWCHINCPVCGVSLWVSATSPVRYEPHKEAPPE